MLQGVTKIKTPCKACEKRCLGCHANCEDYKQFRKDIEEQKKQEKLNKEYQPNYHKYYKKKPVNLGKYNNIRDN
jgi:hypothetical protein